MIYVLRHIYTGETVVLGANSTYTLGRSQCNDVQLKEPTCSREHAVIEIKDKLATIDDNWSNKRGTYVNNIQIEDKTQLQAGDRIRFGLNKCIYSFLDPKFRTVMGHRFSEITKRALQEALQHLNVKLSDTYTRACTHFTTELVTLEKLRSTQILEALVDKKPIVTPKFWIKMFRQIEEAAEIPNVYKYVPEVEAALKDKGVVDKMLFRKNRKELFKDKLCIFSDKTAEEKLEDLIRNCGGGTLLHDKTSNVKTLVEGIEFDEAIVICDKSGQSTLFSHRLRKFEKIVQEFSVDDIFVVILKGSFQTASATRIKPENSDEIEGLNWPGTSKGTRNAQANLGLDTDSVLNQPGTSRGSKQAQSDFDSDPDRFLNQPGTSKSSEKAQTTKKSERRQVSLNRWIQSPKRPPKTQKKQNEDKEDEFDTSLDLGTSDDSSEEQLKVTRKRKDPFQIDSDCETQDGHPTTRHPIEIFEDSSTDEETNFELVDRSTAAKTHRPVGEQQKPSAPIQTTQKPKNDNNSNVHKKPLPTWLSKNFKKFKKKNGESSALVESGSSIEPSPDLLERLRGRNLDKIKEEDSSHYNTARSNVSVKEMQSVEIIEDIQECISISDVESPVDSGFERKATPRKQNNTGSHDMTDDLEESELIFKRSRPKRDEKSAERSPESQSKKLKINPFARPIRASTSVLQEKSGDIPLDLQRLGEIFTDVDFSEL